MKKSNLLSILLSLTAWSTYAQEDSLKTISLTSTDTLPSPRLNAYNGLMEDNPAYNPKRSVLLPISEIFLVNGVTWAVDRYVLDAEYARIGPDTWKANLTGPWVWDDDGFGVNFIGHPYSGALFYSAARSNGYSFGESFPFAVGGSLMWEYFGENTAPSYNDIVNTPVNGTFLGEVMYRISSNILDDRTVGGERFFRELAAGLISPVRGFNRLMTGETGRVTNEEVYQTEPLNITLYGGVHKRGTEQDIFKGDVNTMVNLQLDYGNPFEQRPRKPFDLFRLRTELSFGVGRKVLDNLTGYGLLFGRTSEPGTFTSLVGGFQYYDYWDNNTFELASIAFGGAGITKLDFTDKTNLYTSLHLGIVPLAGNSFESPDTTTELRDYQYGTGAQGKFETTLNLGGRLTIRFNAYYYYIRALVESTGNNFIGILEPNVSLRLFKNLSIGFEHYVYLSDRSSADFDTLHKQDTQQKVFLLYFFENDKRGGRYH